MMAYTLVAWLWIAGGGPALADEPLADGVRLIVTGGSGGIGSGAYQFSLPAHLKTAIERVGGSVDEANAYHGVLAQGYTLVVAQDRSVKSVVAFFNGSRVSCTEPERIVGMRTDTELAVLPSFNEPPDWLWDLPGGVEQVQTWTCSNQLGAVVQVYSPPGFKLPLWELELFEFRVGIVGKVRIDDRPVTIDVIGHPTRDGARRFAQVRELLQGHRDALYIDAGSFVDGISAVADGELSPLRPLGFEMLERLRPSALAIGETELAKGAKSFFEEIRGKGLPYVGTNWKTEDEAMALPAVLHYTVHTSRGPQRVAFLGVTDPGFGSLVHMLIDDGITLVDPVRAVRETVVALQALPTPPDLVVVLTSGLPSLIAELRREVIGIDLVVGDATSQTGRMRHLTLEVQHDLDGTDQAASVLPLDGIFTVDVTFDRDGLTGVHVVRRAVHHAVEPDPEVLASVTRVRAEVYPGLDHPLLEAPESDPTLPVPVETWDRVVCEAVREYADADLVLLPELPKGTTLPGPLGELVAVDRLALLDQLEVHWIPGGALPRLSHLLHSSVPVSCGMDLRAGAPMARGRPIQAERLYRMVTTDRARRVSKASGITGKYSSRVLDQPGYRLLRGPEGEPVTLRTAVLTVLRAHRDDPAREQPVVQVLTDRSPADKPPEWLLRVRQMAFRVSRFQGANDSNFGNMSETLATSPSSTTLGGDLDSSFEFTSRRMSWDVRGVAAYARLHTANDQPQETADDWKLSTSVSLPGVRLPITPKWGWMPYGEIRLDSEFTPTKTDAGLSNPLQLDLSVTLGLSSTSVGPLRVLRLGALAEKAMTYPDKTVAFGGRIDGETVVSFGPMLSWRSLLAFSVYANTRQQDDADFRFKTLVDTKLSLPLSRWLSTAVYGQAFLFSGRVPPSDIVGFSWTFGFQLDISGAFVLRAG